MTALHPAALAIIDRLRAVPLNMDVDRPKATAALKEHYALLGLPEPEVIWFSSDRRFLAAARDAARAAARDAARAAARAAARDAAWAAAWEAAWDAARDAALAATWEAAWAAASRGAGSQPYLPLVSAFEAGLFAYLPTDRGILALERPILNIDREGRLHSEIGPAVSWADGERIYFWHGVGVPADWIEDRDNLDPAKVLRVRNTDQRAAGMAIVGWQKAERVLGSRIVHDSGDPEEGTLIEMKLPGVERPGRFLKAACPRNGLIFAPVMHVSEIDGLPIDTARAAQAWLARRSQADYQPPPRRT